MIDNRSKNGTRERDKGTVPASRARSDNMINNHSNETTIENGDRQMPQIVLGVTGSIAAYKAADLANRLTKDGAIVNVVMTRNAQEFVAPLTFSTLTKRPVYTDSFADTPEYDVEHIGLAKAADVLVIAPATANVIGKIANGIADDLLTTVTMAAAGHGAPVVICPAMNTAMYENPLVQGNIEKLTALGYRFIEPRESILACGDLGRGALADVEVIITTLKEITSTRPV
jgi:phosphopantothenoylcysteine decarboxylase/phosphopantothenoylcysteine decarboxylase/phosphopantothenate--cysteine ligase